MTNYNDKSTPITFYSNVYLDKKRRRTLNLTANANIDRNVTDRFIPRAYRLLLNADLLLRSVCELPQVLHRWTETAEAPRAHLRNTALETINSEEMQEHSTSSPCPYSQGLTKTTEHFINVCTGNKILRIWKLERHKGRDRDILKCQKRKEYKLNNFEKITVLTHQET